MSLAALTSIIPKTVTEWVTIVKKALQLKLNELYLPEHFFLRDLKTGVCFSPLRIGVDSGIKQKSAVLLLLSPSSVDTGKNGFQEMCITLTKRTSKLRRHKNQISFPGGRMDENETPIVTAQRETMEEVGINSSSYNIIGSLNPIKSVDGGSLVIPIVAIANSTVTPICNSPNEVASIHYLHLLRLLINSSETHCRLIKYKSMTYSKPVHFPCFFASTSQSVYTENISPTLGVPTLLEDAEFSPIIPDDFPGELVWGLTAFVLCEFLARLSVVLSRSQPQELSERDFLKCTSVVARDPDLPPGKL